VTVRGHFASNSAYPCQASSSVFNCFSNWLGFMVRRVDVYSRYFSQLEKSKNKHDFHNRYTREKACSSLGDFFSFTKGECLVSLSYFDIVPFSSPSSLELCALFRFSSVISREKSHHPRIEISRILDRVSYTDYLSSPAKLRFSVSTMSVTVLP